MVGGRINQNSEEFQLYTDWNFRKCVIYVIIVTCKCQMKLINILRNFNCVLSQIFVPATKGADVHTQDEDSSS